MMPPPTPPNNKPPQQPQFRVPGWLIPMLIAMFILWFSLRLGLPGRLTDNNAAPIDIPYSFFTTQVAADKVDNVKMEGSQVSGDFKVPITWPLPGSTEAQQTPPATSKLFTTTLPPINDNDLLPLLRQHDVTVRAADPHLSPFLLLLFNYGPFLLTAGLLLWSSPRPRQQRGTIFAFGKRRARRYSEERPQVTFGDVAGEDAAK